MFTAATPNEMPDRDLTLSMSGLAFMQSIKAGKIACPPIWDLMSMSLEDVAEGRVSFRGGPRFAHLNPASGVHGGWYGTILDSCMSCAVMTKVPQGSVYTTLEYKVNLIAAIPAGADVIATGQIDHAGRSTGIAQGRVVDAVSGKLYATGSATCLIMRLAKD